MSIACAGHEIGEDSVQIYREVLHPSGEVIYQSKHGKHEGMGPLHGQPILASYPPLEGLQQKRLAARRHKTTYAYDFPTVFGNALRELWTARAIAGEPCAAPKGALPVALLAAAPATPMDSSASLPFELERCPAAVSTL